MSETKCNYQSKVTVTEVREALGQAECHHCGIAAADLMARGELLEVCGEEIGSDLVTGTRILKAIALCPSCHRRSHLDANRQHNPCQIKARNSRESACAVFEG